MDNIHKHIHGMTDRASNDGDTTKKVKATLLTRLDGLGKFPLQVQFLKLIVIQCKNIFDRARFHGSIVFKFKSYCPIILD